MLGLSLSRLPLRSRRYRVERPGHIAACGCGTAAQVRVVMPSNATRASAEWLAYLPVHRQLELFRQKRFSPIDVLEAQIARIERGSQSINAVTCRHFDGARSAAKKSEARYHRGAARTLE